jgi:peroxiredoxin Q/BCP
MKTIIIAAALISSMNFLHAKGIEIGQPAPQLKATIQTGDEVDLGAAFSEGITLIFFYPKADTPGCTAQACSLRDSFQELVEAGINVYGVSYDSPEKQSAFKDKYNLPFDLIADEDKQVSKSFDRKGWFSRQAYMVQDGKIIWRDLSASTQSQAADVKAALMDLGLADFPSMQTN